MGHHMPAGMCPEVLADTKMPHSVASPTKNEAAGAYLPCFSKVLPELHSGEGPRLLVHISLLFGASVPAALRCIKRAFVASKPLAAKRKLPGASSAVMSAPELLPA